MPIIVRNGRTIRRGRDYSLFRRELFLNQTGRCIECNRLTSFEMDIDSDYSFHVAHRGSRGMGAAIRDDVVGPKRGQVEGGKCGKCHRQEHGQ
jgi:hypothetical protein